MVSLITIVSLMILENLELQNVYKVVKTQEKPGFVTRLPSHNVCWAILSYMNLLKQPILSVFQNIPSSRISFPIVSLSGISEKFYCLAYYNRLA